MEEIQDLGPRYWSPLASGTTWQCQKVFHAFIHSFGVSYRTHPKTQCGANLCTYGVNPLPQAAHSPVGMGTRENKRAGLALVRPRCMDDGACERKKRLSAHVLFSDKRSPEQVHSSSLQSFCLFLPQGGSPRRT